jgi:hypothetical protein
VVVEREVRTHCTLYSGGVHLTYLLFATITMPHHIPPPRTPSSPFFLPYSFMQQRESILGPDVSTLFSSRSGEVARINNHIYYCNGYSLSESDEASRCNTNTVFGASNSANCTNWRRPAGFVPHCGAFHFPKSQQQSAENSWA